MNAYHSLPSAEAIQRVTTRLIVEFLIKAVCGGARAHGGNLERSLTYFAIQHANVEHLSRDATLAWKYADEYPPDDVRRPISVHALAQALAASPETTRRRVAALIADGACVKVDGRGVIVPVRHLTTAQIRAHRLEVLTGFDEMIGALGRIGFDFSALVRPRARTAAATPRGREPAPVLLVSRIINGYCLKVILDSIPLHGDFITAVLFVLIMADNTRHITHDPELAWRYAGANDAPPDELRSPVSVRQIATKLGMPYSTVQRQLVKMAEKGFCQRRDGGYIIHNASMNRPEILANGLRMHLWFLAMLGELTALGLDFSDWTPICSRGAAARGVVYA
jgi:DNA-binding transcriptional regulator YhcF (GntR family)